MNERAVLYQGECKHERKHVKVRMADLLFCERCGASRGVDKKWRVFPSYQPSSKAESSA